VGSAGAPAVRLRAGTALDADRCAGPCDVVVRDGRIAAIEPFGSPAAPGERVLGGESALVMPGLVNAHTHLAMTLLRGVGPDAPLDVWLRSHIWPAEGRMTAEDVYWGSLLGAVEGLLGGTTAFVDMYFHEDQVARACRDAGVRASLAIGLAGQGDALARRLDAAGETIATWRAGAADDRVEMRLGPHAPYTCPPAALQTIARTAEILRCGVHIHLAETRAEVDEARAAHGRTPVELAAEAGLFGVPAQVAHVVWPAPGDARLLAEAGAVVGHCPASNLQLGSGVAPALDLVDAGVRLALGTDGAASAPGLDMLDNLRLAWLVAKGRAHDPRRPTAREAFAWATRGGAAALGRDDLGRLAVGATADLVVVELDRPGLWPLPDDPYALVVEGVRASDVAAVLVDGIVRVEGGRPVGIDLGALRREVLARARRLRAG